MKLWWPFSIAHGPGQQFIENSCVGEPNISIVISRIKRLRWDFTYVGILLCFSRGQDLENDLYKIKFVMTPIEKLKSHC